MTLEKNRYSAAMDKLHVTPEEREQLLERALERAQQQKTAPRAVRTCRRWAPLAAAACICLVLAGVMVIPSWSDPAASPPVQVTNPIVQSEDLEALRSAAPFALSVPTELPEGWKVESASLIMGSLAQVVYTDGTDTITYRMAEGTKDVSGDYNAYPWTEDADLDGVTVTLKGQQEDAVLLAVWTDGQYSYAFSCSAPLTAEQAAAMAGSVAPLE